MDFLPIFLNIRGRHCAVIGGGDVAARKISLLLQAGGKVSVTAPQLCPSLQARLQAGEISWHAGEYTPSALATAVLVIAASNDRAVNARVSHDAQARQLPVNVVDDPELCSYIMPAIIDRSPMIVAVSTGGASPVLARLARARLESLLPARYGDLAQLAERFRERVKAALPESLRRRFWEGVLQGPIAELVLAGRTNEAEQQLAATLVATDAKSTANGEIYLVGAGPGNPELLTFAALRLMQQADVVLHDHLVSPAILELTRRDAERIYVGKAGSIHTLRQAEINRLLLKLAKEGKRVLRLKGGDPYIFGRGSEEIDTLSAAGIPFQVVPGITAAAGAAAYAGIPLTHRELAQSCLFVTGHLKDGQLDLDWPALVRPQQTVVVYMGLPGIKVLCQQLISHGLPASTPAAIVQRATLADQRVLTGTLATLPAQVETANLLAPTLIIVGATVGLQAKLAWFDGAQSAASGH